MMRRRGESTRAGTDLSESGGRPRSATARLLGAGVALCALISPTPAVAACGGAVVGQPGHRVPGQPPPLAIGDSTMLLSVPGLAGAGYEVNARSCRQLYQAVTILASLRALNQLPHMVVIALGANRPITAAELGAAQACGPRRRRHGP